MSRSLRSMSGFVLICIIALGSWFATVAASPQHDAEATIEALQTRVAELESENSELRTQVTVPATSTLPQSSAIPTSAASEKPMELADGLQLLSYRFIYSGLYFANDDDKATFVVGEIKNNTDRELDAPGLKFVLLDEKGNIVGDINADPILPVIMPDQVMPIQSAIFGDEPKPSEWKTEHIDLCGSWGTSENLAEYDPTHLKLQNLMEKHTGREISFSGSVLNGSDQPAKGVYIKAAIFDKSGRFSGWFWTALDVPIPAGKSEQFQFNSVGDPHDPVGVAGDGYTYKLWVGFDSAFSIC